MALNVWKKKSHNLIYITLNTATILLTELLTKKTSLIKNLDSRISERSSSLAVPPVHKVDCFANTGCVSVC